MSELVLACLCARAPAHARGAETHAPCMECRARVTVDLLRGQAVQRVLVVGSDRSYLACLLTLKTLPGTQTLDAQVHARGNVSWNRASSKRLPSSCTTCTAACACALMMDALLVVRLRVCVRVCVRLSTPGAGICVTLRQPRHKRRRSTAVRPLQGMYVLHARE